MKEIYDAVKDNDLERVKSLVLTNKDIIHARDENDISPLMWAAFQGNVPIAEFLLKNGADVNAISKNIGSAVIHFAAESDNVQMLKLLVAAGADINAQNLQEKASVLHHAVMAKRFPIVQELLDLGVNIDVVSASGDTALHAAIHVGNKAILKILVHKGINVDAKNNAGETALASAYRLSNMDFVKIICKYKKLNVQNYICDRQLSNVFNDTKICQELEKDGCSYTSGGNTYEGVAFICEFLKEYIALARQCFNTQPLLKIAANLEALKSKYQTKAMSLSLADKQKLANFEPIYFLTGFDSHVVPGKLHYHSDYSFSLYDRGFFANFSSNGKVFPIFRAGTNDEKIAQETFEELSQAIHADQATGSDILMKKIPDKLGKYVVDQTIKQSPFKRGRCYFENVKSLLLDELIQYYGIVNGKLIYKDFDLFMHYFAAQKFSLHSNRDNRLIILDRCEEKIKTKRQALNQLNHNDYPLVMQDNFADPNNHIYSPIKKIL